MDGSKLLAKASKRRHVGLVEYFNDQKLAEEVNQLNVNNTEVMLTEGISDKKEDSNPESKIRKKRRKKNRPSEKNVNQFQESTESISKDVSVASSSGDPSTLGAAALEVASQIEKSSTRSDSISTAFSVAETCNSDSRIIRGAEALEAASPHEASSVILETHFKIKKGEPHDTSLEKADYRDKVTSMIAAKARSEWEDKMKDFDNLQEEKEELKEKIRIGENQLDVHKVKVTEMINNQEREMTNYNSIISKTEDEKAENDKEIKKLEAQIGKIKEIQKECDAKIKKMERKRKELEEYMETEMSKMKVEETAIIKNIERLNKALRSNIKATEDLARF